MDFIERLLGFSPDAGSGSFELLLFMLPVLGLAVFVNRHPPRRGDSGFGKGSPSWRAMWRKEVGMPPPGSFRLFESGKPHSRGRVRELLVTG